jgi:hypothetical protein
VGIGKRAPHDAGVELVDEATHSRTNDEQLDVQRPDCRRYPGGSRRWVQLYLANDVLTGFTDTAGFDRAKRDSPVLPPDLVDAASHGIVATPRTTALPTSASPIQTTAKPTRRPRGSCRAGAPGELRVYSESRMRLVCSVRVGRPERVLGSVRRPVGAKHRESSVCWRCAVAAAL